MGRPQKFRHSRETLNDPQVAEKLGRFVLDIEALRQTRKQIDDQLAAAYDAVDDGGFEKKFVRKVVSLRAKETDKRRDEEEGLEVYEFAIEKGISLACARSKPNLPPHDEETGEIIEEPETEHQSEQPCTATGPSEEAGASPDETPATILPDPHLPTAADGQRGIQSSAADGAKSEAASAPSPVGSAQAGRHYVQAEQAVTNSQSSRAPVETDPLREQADVKTAGTNPRETRPSASVALTNQQPGPQSNSHAQPSSSAEAHKADDAPPPASSATPFDNPRCKHPGTCHLAHSEDSCLDCVLTWAKLPKDEQVQRWADAHGAVA